MSASPASPVIADPAARWAAVFAAVNERIEGGFVNDAADKGGATKYGLSLRFLAGEERIDPNVLKQFQIGHDGEVDVADVRNLTPAKARGVFRDCFWIKSGACTLPQPIDAAVYDQAVNDGIVPAVRMLQTAINGVGAAHIGSSQRVVVDGVPGPATTAACKALNAAVPWVLVARLRALAAQRYRAIVTADPSQSKFLPGWLLRAEHLGDV